MSNISLAERKRKQREIVLGDDDINLETVKESSNEDFYENEQTYADLKSVLKEFEKIGNNNLLKNSISNMKDQKDIMKIKELVIKQIETIEKYSKSFSNKEIMMHVLQIIEDSFYRNHKAVMNPIKLKLATDLLKPLYSNMPDEYLVELIESNVKSLSKTTFFKRNKNRLLRVGAFFLGIFSILK